MKTGIIVVCPLVVVGSACNRSRRVPSSTIDPVTPERRPAATILASAGVPPSTATAPAVARLQNFESDTMNAPPAGFSFGRTGSGYYLTRADAQLANWSGRITSSTWHEYRFDIRNSHLEVFWNGRHVLAHDDVTFAEPGLVGVWTKADSVTYFDNLSVEPF